MDILSSQKNIIEFIQNSKKRNRLSHAYMFEGTKGVGKLDAALYFVCSLWCNCDEPCLKCNTCKQILNMNFLNLIYINTNKEVITVDQIAKLQKEFASTSVLDGPRVYIIDDAHKMQPRVQNKLLKFIEEPISDNTFGILLTTNEDKIISTIKSRVITLSFNELSYEYLVNKLLENNIEDKYAYLLPHIENSIDNCLKIIEQKDTSVLDLVYKFINKLEEKDITFFYKENNEVLSIKKNLLVFINMLEEFYKDLYNVIYNQKPKTFVNIDYTILKKLYKVSYITEIIDTLVELEHNLMYNVNINLSIIKMIMKLSGGVIN